MCASSYTNSPAAPTRLETIDAPSAADPGQELAVASASAIMGRDTSAFRKLESGTFSRAEPYTKNQRLGGALPAGKL